MKLKYLFLFLSFLLFVQLSAQEETTDEEIASALEEAQAYVNGKAYERIKWDFGKMGIGMGAYLAEGSGFKMPTMYNYLDQTYWRSGQFYVEAVDLSIGLLPKGKEQRIRLATGIRYNLADYSFSRDFQLIEGQETFQAAVVDADKEIRRHRLHAHYVQIPFILEFFSKPADVNKSINLAIGYTHNLRFASNYKVKYEDKEKLKVKDDFNLNPSFGMLEARLGVGQLNIYVQYGLDGLFVDGNGPAVTPINIGIVAQ